jgi:hypothetical protein
MRILINDLYHLCSCPVAGTVYEQRLVLSGASLDLRPVVLGERHFA